MQTKHGNKATYAIVRQIQRFTNFENVKFVYVNYKGKNALIDEVMFTVWLN